MSRRQRKAEQILKLWEFFSVLLCLGVGYVVTVSSFGIYMGMHYVDSTIEPVADSVICTDIVLLTAQYALYLVPLTLLLGSVNRILFRKTQYNYLSFTTFQGIFLWTGLLLSSAWYYWDRVIRAAS